MNLIDAIKSGKRFRRTDCESCWMRMKGEYMYNDHDVRVFFSADHLLGDWEIEEERREFSWSEIAKAVDSMEDKPTFTRYDLHNELKKALGFEGE